MASLSTKTGSVKGFLEALEDVDAHPFGQDGALRHGSRAPVDGARESRRRHPPGRCVPRRCPAEQPVQHPDGGVDAFLGVVAQGKQDRFLGDHVVTERGEHHAQVPPAEVDADGDGAVAVEPDVQGAPPGAGGRLGGGQPGLLHDPDDVGDRGRGEAGLPGQLRLGGRARQEAFDDPLLVQMPEGGLRSGVFGSAPR